MHILLIQVILKVGHLSMTLLLEIIPLTIAHIFATRKTKLQTDGFISM